jgi:CRISPR/Cas system-associated protein Csm6
MMIALFIAFGSVCTLSRISSTLVLLMSFTFSVVNLKRPIKRAKAVCSPHRFHSDRQNRKNPARSVAHKYFEKLIHYHRFI